ncbi:Golgi resident protein GCP60 isoform X2 [Ceratina calcarata]|uniref:Golgi resident protein GCP60 isoform X2 n=1 Tax=Ceratina calcarata TaxID=156304 RepID=A0AAJ7S2E8_9HYME|nr:Golgi resident protein GCP60 isoform X2 [Ceratina calcarata]
MAGANGDISSVERKIEKLAISAEESLKNENEREIAERPESRLWGFETKELYKIAVNFYREKAGKAVHLSYEDKMKLVAFTQQVTHGKYIPEKALPLGVLDVIGRDRRLAWQNLGDISKEQAMEGFIILLDKLCPLFRTVVEAQKRDIEEKLRLKEEEEARKLEEQQRLRELEEERKREEEARLKEEIQRRQIQDALNQQTYYQFKMYAEQQYPGNPEQQGVLIRQLQEQHYHQYMQQLHQNQLVMGEQTPDMNDTTLESTEKDEQKDTNETVTLNEEDSDDLQDAYPSIVAAKMWTRKGVEEFKEIIRREDGDAVIKVGHGEIVTVRVPTHKDGSCLFWEFATDGYDIGFGVYFEWSKPETNQVSVHISESEDEDDEDDDFESRDDLESGVTNGTIQSDYKPMSPPISVIVPIYRRDSQEEIYAGSHKYPGQVSGDIRILKE